jgi:hypothetical protein
VLVQVKLFQPSPIFYTHVYRYLSNLGVLNMGKI